MPPPTLRAAKRSPNDYLVDALTKGLTTAGVSEPNAYRYGSKLANLLGWTPLGIPQAGYEAGQLLGSGASQGSGTKLAAGTLLGALAAVPDMSGAVGKVIHGLSDIRAPTDDINRLIDANFEHGRAIGNDTVPLAELKYGVSQGENPGRVKALAEQIGAPGGYFARPVIDQDGNVLEGQHRTAALASLGAKDVPVYRVRDTFAGIDRPQLVEAIKKAGPIPGEHASQIAAHAATMTAEAGSPGAVPDAFDLNGPFEKHFRAALDNIGLQQAPAAQGITAYHGSPVAGLATLKASERGPFGPAVYLSTNSGVAARYGENVYPAQLSRSDIFHGMGSTGLGSNENPYQIWRDQGARLAAAAGPKGPEVAALIEKLSPSDGYPFFRHLAGVMGSDEGAQQLMRAAGFKGVSGHIDGPEIAVFGDHPLQQ